MNVQELPIDQIRIDGGTQARAAINDAVVAEYAEVLTDGGELPPVVVFFDGASYFLADGFHRFHANRKIGARTLRCDVRTGTLMDAKLFAYGANAGHGLRRSNDDKRKAVLGMLAEFADWSDRAIATHVGVSHPFVASVRQPEATERQKAARQASEIKKVVTDSTPDAGEQGDDEADSTPKVESVTTPAEPAVPASELAQAREQLDELAANLQETLADNNAMAKVFEADDKLAQAMAENKQLRAEVSTLRERVNGLLNEKNEAVRLAKHWKRKAEKVGEVA